MGRLEKKGKTGDYYWRLDSRMGGILLEIMSLVEFSRLKPWIRNVKHFLERGIMKHF